MSAGQGRGAVPHRSCICWDSWGGHGLFRAPGKSSGLMVQRWGGQLGTHSQECVWSGHSRRHWGSCSSLQSRVRHCSSLFPMAELNFPKEDSTRERHVLGGVLATTGPYFLGAPHTCSCFSPFVSWAPGAGRALCSSGGKFPCSEESSVALSHDVDLWFLLHCWHVTVKAAY